MQMWSKRGRRTLAGLGLHAHTEVVRGGRKGNESEDLLQEGSIRRVHLHDQHSSTELRLHLIGQVDVEGGTLLALGGGNSQGGDRRLRGRRTGAHFQILANSNEVGVYTSSLRSQHQMGPITTERTRKNQTHSTVSSSSLENLSSSHNTLENRQ